MNVVGRIILGFASLAVLLGVTSVISYIGLAEIRASAISVVEQKMPVQAQMLNVQTDILTLAKISTSGFNADSSQNLSDNFARFNTLASEFESHLQSLNRLIEPAGKRAFESSNEQAVAYLAASRKMYQQRQEQLLLNGQITTKADEILLAADEASALMMDLSYLESDSPSLETLIGTGTNIDNKIVPFLNSVKEYVSVIEPELNQTIRGDIEFALSNIDSDAQYLNRLAEEVENDGIVDAFNGQYQSLTGHFTDTGGLFALQERKIALILAASADMQNADNSLNLAIDGFSSLFEQINRDTLAGQNAILDAVQSNIWKSAVMVVFALAFVVSMGYLAARSIAKPLARINRSLSIIAKGDLTHQARTDSNDEFSVLASNVNKLSASLHHVVGQILAQEKALEQATQESVELGEKTLLQVDQQREQVNTTAQNTQMVRETSQNNLGQIQFAMQQLETVSDQSKQVGDLVNLSCEQITDQAQQARKSSEVIHRLQDNSHKIGGILDVIKTIAEQTNLLALNAAIEAARAGEQGRGFAVVADEVRTLANRTHDSTEEIESMIAALQKDAEQAVEAIALGSQQAEESVQLIDQVNHQVANIGEVIRGLSDVNQQIVKETGDQDRLLQSVADSLQRIVELAEQSACSTQSSNEATQQVDGLMQTLKQAVSRFKL